MVGHGLRPLGLVLQVVVPAGPRAAAPREQRAVGVQHRVVALVGDRAEQLAPRRRSGRRACAAPGRSGRRSRPRRSCSGSPPAGVTSTRSSKRSMRRPGVDSRSRSPNGARSPPRSLRAPPLTVRQVGRSREAEHAVVGEELGEQAGREVPHPRGSADQTADACGHDQPLHELRRVAALVEELAERRAGSRSARSARAPRG